MNDSQYESLRMYQQLKAALEKHTTVWSGNVRLSADVSLFLLNLTGIEAQAVAQEVNMTGIGKVKKALRGELVEQAMLAATAIRTFAHDNKDQELKATVYYKESFLKRTREMALVAACQVILDHATTQATFLSDYGVTSTALTELQTALTQFKMLTPKTQTAILSTKAVTRNLATLFRDTNELIKEGMDGKLLQYKKKSPAFFTDYTHARPVIKLSGKAKKTVKSVQPVVAALVA